MTQKWELVSLPRWEMTAYWILSFSSHLYSFYQLHKFSKGELPFWPRTKHKLPQVIREAVSTVHFQLKRTLIQIPNLNKSQEKSVYYMHNA